MWGIKFIILFEHWDCWVKVISNQTSKNTDLTKIMKDNIWRLSRDKTESWSFM